MKKIILILSLILMEAGTTRFLFSEELGPVKPRTPSYSKEEIFELWNGNKKGEALEKLDQWMNADRKSPEPWVTAAAIAFNDGRYKRCLKMGEKALEKSPQSAGAYYWRGRAFEAMSNWLDAANEYNASLLIEPDYSVAKESLAKVKSHLSEARP